MTKQQELEKQVKGKNKASNIMICLRILFDLIPQVLLIKMTGMFFEEKILRTEAIVYFAIILGCFVFKAVFSYLATRKAHDAAYACLSELRSRIVNHLKKLPLGFFQEHKTGELTKIMEYDVEQIEGYLAHGLPEVMSATLLPCAVFVAMLFVHPGLALAMVVGLPLMWITKKAFASLWAKNFRIYADSVTQMQENIMEYVANIPVIKAFGKEETKTSKTLESAKQYDFWAKKSMAGISVPMGLITFFMESGVVLVMILGTYLLSEGWISVTQLILSIVLGGLFTSSVAKTATFQHYGIVFGESMKGVAKILAEEAPSEASEYGDPENGDITVSSLCFAYKGKEKILDDINLVIPKGSKTALVGASGCGKTTLAGLLMGFWKPSSGHISIGGTDTANASQQGLNRLFSVVQQDVFLFNTTIEENIRIGKPDATGKEIVEAAKKACIHDFIMSLPNGYETQTGEAGVKFSGGEKQRIAIARMILKDAPIVILDEATAAVDAENEAYIKEAIDNLGKDKTIITIAHHLSTIRDSDQIVVMENGRVEGKGTHEELMKECDLYATMVLDQERSDNWSIRKPDLRYSVCQLKRGE